MKNMWLILSVIISLCLTSCSDDEITKLDDYAFTKNGNAWVPTKGQQNFSDADFQKLIAGHGWRCIEGYKINDDGSVNPTNIFPIDGGAPYKYYFGKDGCTIYLVNYNFTSYYWDLGYNYDGGTGIVSFDEPKNEGITILSYDRKKGLLTLLDHVSFYNTVLVYRSMTDEELETIRSRHTVNYEEERGNAYTPEMEGICGNWYLKEVNRGFGGVQTFVPDEISYCFYNNGPLVVQDTSGKERVVFHPAGTYEYSFDEEAGTIAIDGSTYRCVLEGNNLTIDTGSAWDGPIFTFVRRIGSVGM